MFNASDIIKGNIHLIDPIATFTLSPEGVAINQFTTRWQDGLLRTLGVGPVLRIGYNWVS